jgi:hypothetical protein
VKVLAATFIIALLLSALAVAVLFGIVHAKPSVPEFTLQYVDYSYDVPPTTTSTTDPYTNETITTAIPGYHVENKTIQATINNNIGASYYNFRYKGRYEDEWRYHPFRNGSLGYMLPDAFYVPYQASTSDYTVAALPSYFFKDIPVGGEVDVQVQALFGDFRAEPYVHITPVGGPTYDFYFEGTTSDWSKTQTIKIGEIQLPTPSPATTPTPTPPNFGSTSPPNHEPLLTPEQLGIIVGVAITAAVICAGLGLLIYLIKRK